MNNGADEQEEEFGYCDLHEEYINEETYEYKGCWNCFHFWEGEGFPYVTVPEASKELGFSQSTVRRWIRSGMLKGRLFTQRRRTRFLPAPPTYHIEKESLEALKRALACTSRTGRREQTMCKGSRKTASGEALGNFRDLRTLRKNQVIAASSGRGHTRVGGGDPLNE